MRVPLFVVCVACTMPWIARAQISPTGPFVGTSSDGFESAGCSPLCAVQCFGVLPWGGSFGGGNAVCAGAAGGNALIITTGWPGQCALVPHSGTLLLAGVAAPVEITFAVMVERFGGYFADAEMQGSATVEFFDQAGSAIGPPLPLALNACGWTWNGWESSGPFIKRVRISGSAGSIQMDDLQSDRICYGTATGTGASPRRIGGASRRALCSGTRTRTATVPGTSRSPISGASEPPLSSAAGEAVQAPHGAACRPIAGVVARRAPDRLQTSYKRGADPIVQQSVQSP